MQRNLLVTEQGLLDSACLIPLNEPLRSNHVYALEREAVLFYEVGLEMSAGVPHTLISVSAVCLEGFRMGCRPGDVVREMGKRVQRTRRKPYELS